MIIISIEEPTPQQVGHIWFDVGSKKTSRAQQLHTGLGASSIAPGPATLIWVPVLPPGCQRGPQNKIGDVAIHMGTMIPEVWDGHMWISAVPPNYPFPSQTPQAGDTWTDPLSSTVFVHDGLKWLKLTTNHPTATPTVSGQNINLAPSPARITINAGSQNTIFMQQTSGHVLEIFGPNRQRMVAIDSQKFTVTYGPSYNPDAAARIFWEAIAEKNPKRLEEKIESLTRIHANICNRNTELEQLVEAYKSTGAKLPYKAPSAPVNPVDAWDAAMGVIK